MGLCIAAFANKRDERLLSVLILANIAFATQFFLLGGWVAGAISCLIVLRILLVRRYKGNSLVMGIMLAATAFAALITWQSPLDFIPVVAGLIGTYAMFMLHGIPMRVLLAVAAVCWMLANYLTGSLGAFIAEGIILTTNAVTVFRLTRDNIAQDSSRAVNE